LARPSAHAALRHAVGLRRFTHPQPRRVCDRRYLFFCRVPAPLASCHPTPAIPQSGSGPSGISPRGMDGQMVVKRTYLSRLGARAPSVESLEPGEAPGELLLEFGIHRADPVYFLRNPSVSEQESAGAELRAVLAPLFKRGRVSARVFTNSRPDLDDAVLMLSDSFG